jgi:predicted nucleic acid-binding protein
MKPVVLLDTGPLVAFLSERDADHAWAIAQFQRLQPPWLTCEAVITETTHLLRDVRGAQVAILEMIERGALQVPFDLESEAAHVRRLMSKYSDVPMSLADACLVRMAELNPTPTVLTLDRHFNIYKKNNRQAVPTFMPAE